MAVRTLRGRLLLGILVLVTLGLAGTDLIIYYTISSTVTMRMDRGLVNAADGVVHARSGPEALLRNIDAVVSRTDISVLMVDPGGRIIAALPEAPAASSPRLDPSALAFLRRNPGRPQEITVAGRPYRMIYQAAVAGMMLDDRAGFRRSVAAVVVAAGFVSEQRALARLAAQEALVSVAVLTVLAFLAVGVLRLGLRPLAGMAVAATAIADGASDRRLPAGRPHDEVGQLAAALNRAFDERHQAEERLRRFVADASHELRTPLATIRGWADLHFQGALGDQERVDIAMMRIMNDADRLIRLVEELLLLARLDEYRGLDTRRVDLVELVSEVADGARMADSTRPITVSAPDSLTLTGDHDKLCQVVRNLVGNALQHTPPGTGVHLTLDRHGDEPASIRLTVADDGPGIPGPDLDKIFERFYRPSRASTTGTGLGLAITRAIVQAHHGTITVESAPGTGTRFDVVLPG